MRRLLLAALSIFALAVPLAVVGPAAWRGAAAAPYTVTTLHFAVHAGTRRTCDIVGDLYRPTDASPTHRVPAILTTNGFGGSKDDQAGIGEAFARRDYVVLSYSGLGFGGSDCKISLDDPDRDGVAASRLVSYLGGASGIAFTDDSHTTPAPALDVVRHDAVDHAGVPRAHDPRVGMIGGSYGGEVQFAAASVDPRIDTIVPIVTWNDLAYSLAPDDAAQGPVSGVSSTTPGAVKLAWGLLFSVLGVIDGVENARTDPGRLVGCPNFVSFVCPALITGATTGYFDPTTIGKLRHASVATYLDRIRIPTLLMQGEGDTLFNLDEAAATYRALRAQGTPVKMIWQSWGHSDSTPAPGELDLSALDPATQYESARVVAWFSRYLQDRDADTGPAFAWFRDWVPYDGIATPAYGTSSTFPVGTPDTFYLSGDRLVSSPDRIASGRQRLVTPAAGLPTTSSPLDAIGSYVRLPVPETDLPGTFAQWTSAPLTGNLDVVGSPRLHLRVQAPLATLTEGLGPAGELVLFVRVQDVGPDGRARDIQNLTAPVRVADVRRPFTVRLPAIVHRFATGHRLRLVVAGGSLNYRGGLLSNPVTIRTGSSEQALTLPVTD